MIINSVVDSEELNTSSSSLISSLIAQKLCVANNTNRGFEVNEKFENGKRPVCHGAIALPAVFLNGKAKFLQRWKCQEYFLFDVGSSRK